MGVNGVEGADRLNSPLGGQRPALARRSRTLVQAEEAGRGKGGQARFAHAAEKILLGG
jgi:hypothetical protein